MPILKGDDIHPEVRFRSHVEVQYLEIPFGFEKFGSKGFSDVFVEEVTTTKECL